MNDVRIKLEDQMLTLPSHSAADMLIEIATFTMYGEGCLPERGQHASFWDEVKKYTMSIVGGTA